MNTGLYKILDECIARIGRGETVETVLADYPDKRGQLEPLLQTALSLSALPRVSPSLEFKEKSRARVMARIRQESQVKAELKHGPSFRLNTVLRGVWQPLIGARRFAITVACLIILSLGTFGGLSLASSASMNTSQCTLSILSGTVEVQKPGSDNMQHGTDGMTLSAGTRVKTAPDSHALLTFFYGDTIKLEPGTDLEIKEIAQQEQATSITLKQWMGRTWSRVIKMADPGWRYEIETPSASAAVRGTLFATEVDNAGSTTISTTEGLVSVLAQGKEVYLPPDQQTKVEPGLAPLPPSAVPPPKSEIIVDIDMPAVGSICDPTGSSTGLLPAGVTFNQITGSLSSTPSAGTQRITIAQPLNGQYTLVLRYTAEGNAGFGIKGKSDGKAVFEYHGIYQAAKDSGWLVRLNLNVEAGSIFGGAISSIEPLGSQRPEKIVLPKSVKKPDSKLAQRSVEPDGNPISDKGVDRENTGSKVGVGAESGDEPETAIDMSAADSNADAGNTGNSETKDTENQSKVENKEDIGNQGNEKDTGNAADNKSSGSSDKTKSDDKSQGNAGNKDTDSKNQDNAGNKDTGEGNEKKGDNSNSDDKNGGGQDKDKGNADNGGNTDKGGKGEDNTSDNDETPGSEDKGNKDSPADNGNGQDKDNSSKNSDSNGQGDSKDKGDNGAGSEDNGDNKSHPDSNSYDSQDNNNDKGSGNQGDKGKDTTDDDSGKGGKLKSWFWTETSDFILNLQ